MAERVYCSEVAKGVGAQLAGTAVAVEMWLLIEYPRPWKPKALEDNELDPAINAHIENLALAAAREGLKLRVQFIKQGSSTDREHPLVYLADGRGQARLIRGMLASHQDLLKLELAHLLDFSLPASLTPQLTEESLLLVCTNGQRDLCCARFGLPLFESLRMDFGGRVFQTTHIGGHRFAPNLLCLPSGLVYGFVTPEDAAALVQQHDQGLLSLANLRGRSCYAPLLQAAEVFIRQELLQQISSGQLQMSEGEDGRVDFEFSDARIRHTGYVELVSTELPAVLASCGKAPKPDQQFERVASHLD